MKRPNHHHRRAILRSRRATAAELAAGQIDLAGVRPIEFATYAAGDLRIARREPTNTKPPRRRGSEAA